MGLDMRRFKGGKQSQEWLDWLRDEPAPGQNPQVAPQGAQNSRKPRVHLRPSARIAAELSGREISQNIPANHARDRVTLPRFTESLRKFFGSQVQQVTTIYGKHTKPILAGTGSLVLLVIGGGAYLWLSGSQAPKEQPAVLSESTTSPNFDYTLPDGETAAIEGSVRFDPQRKVVNYKDTVAGVGVTISQQQLPEGLKDDPQEKVKKIAADFSATRALTTATPTAYIGDSIEGPQTVIFTKNDLLIFILSANKLDDKDWAEYVTKLQ